MWKIDRRALLLTFAVLLLVTGCEQADGEATSEAGRPSGRDSPAVVVAAAPGRVEGARETAHLGLGIGGVIEEVTVEIGEKVVAGQILAIIDRDDLAHEEEAARAALRLARSRRLHLLRGTRDEIRRQVTEDERSARAVRDEANSRLGRVEALLLAGAVSEAERDQAKRDMETAEARLRAAEQAVLLAHADPLREEIEQADAAISAAVARLDGARARRDQAVIRAPYDATVLRLHLRRGETVTPVNPQPIISVADLSRLRIRTELDERDVPRVGMKQPAWIEVGGARVAEGRVSWLAPVMGKKSTASGDPAEKADRDVREVLVEVDGSPALIIDQRVTVHFLSRAGGSSQHSSSTTHR